MIHLICNLLGKPPDNFSSDESNTILRSHRIWHRKWSWAAIVTVDSYNGRSGDTIFFI